MTPCRQAGIFCSKRLSFVKYTGIKLLMRNTERTATSSEYYIYGGKEIIALRRDTSKGLRKSPNISFHVREMF